MNPDGAGAAILGMAMDGGELARIPPNAPRDTQISVINEIVDRLNAQLRTQVFTDGTSKRMLIGYQKDGWGTGKDFGIKVSLEGVDVLDADDDQLLFRMALDNWKWRNSNGVLIREFDIENGIERNYQGSKTTPTLVKEFDIENAVEKFYNPSNGDNYMQAGLLPDDTGGFVVAKPGSEVKDLY